MFESLDARREIFRLIKTSLFRAFGYVNHKPRLIGDNWKYTTQLEHECINS